MREDLVAWQPGLTGDRRQVVQMTPHDLRHSAITAWIEHGASVVLASRWAGHSDPGFTLRRYGHLTPLHADGVLDRLDAR